MLAADHTHLVLIQQLDGLGDVNQLAKEAIGRVHIDQVRIHLIPEHVDDLLAFTLAHEAVVHVHALSAS